MMQDGSLEENLEPDSDEEKKSAQITIDLDDDEMKDLEELRSASQEQ